MRPSLAILVSTSLLFLNQGVPQEPSQKPSDKPAEAAPTNSLKQPIAFGLEDGTPIRLRITRNLSSADATTGDRVDFEVLEDVKFKDVIIVPRGGLALGTVTEAEHKRRMARGGKLDVNLDDVRLLDGEKAPLRAVKEVKGGGHTGAMTGAMIGTAIVFFPAAPLFLFMHGKDINIPKGTEIIAYIAGNIPLDRAKFEASDTPAASATPESSGTATVTIASNPAGADVELDGSFVGNTPSSLNLSSGNHTIKISKKGYKAWERTLKASSGTINLNAELEQESH